MPKRRISQTAPGRLSLIPIFLGSLLLFLLVAFWYITHQQFPRLSFVIAHDPMIVYSWDEASESYVVISLPADTSVDAVHGYGRYSLSSLWKLGNIEKKEGLVLSESLEENFAIPVPYYIGKQNHQYVSGKTPEETVRRTFSLLNFFSLFTRGAETNIPWTTFLAAAWNTQGMKADNTKFIDLYDSSVLVPETLPDGTQITAMDRDRFDNVIGQVFENEAVRNEHLSVAVLNTTDTSALGTRAARLLSRLGVNVVTVGNDKPEIGGCIVKGREEELKTITAGLIQSVYGCKPQTIGEINRVDLTVLVGSEYRKRFLPFEK